jgi:hypothetical protein
MARERTIEQALDMFDAWEAAALAAEREGGRRKLREVIADVERHVGRKLKVRRVRCKPRIRSSAGKRRQ